MTGRTIVDGWEVVTGLTAELPDGTTVEGCTWQCRWARLVVPGHGSAEEVTFTSDPGGDFVIVHTFDRWVQR
jgi:hypothetical protein